MKYSNPAPVDCDSAIRRFTTSLSLDPENAAIFWCCAGVLLISIALGGCFALVVRHSAARASDLQDARVHTSIVAVEGKAPWDSQAS